MITKYLFAALAVGATATAQAQPWERLLAASPVMRSALGTPQGVVVDEAGGLFVQSMNATDYGGTGFSHLYALDEQGNHAFLWRLVGRQGWLDSRFVERGFHAFRGERVAWYETGPDTQRYDAIWTFPPGSWYGSELRLPRDGDNEVIAVAADGAGGVLLLRRRSNDAPFGPLPYYTLARHAAGMVVPNWETTVGVCAAGELTLDASRIDFAVDAQDPGAAAVYVLGHCERSGGHPNPHFVERYDLDGNRSSNGEFDPGVAPADIVAWHKLGRGAWLIEQAIGQNAEQRLLRVADGNGAQPLLPWISGAPLRLDVSARGVLVSAPAWPGSADLAVARISQETWAPLQQLTDLRVHPGLAGQLTPEARWTADAQDNRVLVDRLPPPLDDTLAVTAFGLGIAPLAQRLLPQALSPPQLRALPGSGEVVLAFDTVTADNLYAIQVLRFAAASP